MVFILDNKEIYIFLHYFNVLQVLLVLSVPIQAKHFVVRGTEIFCWIIFGGVGGDVCVSGHLTWVPFDSLNKAFCGSTPFLRLS